MIPSEIVQSKPGGCQMAEACSSLHVLSRRISELERRVSTDPLTGLWNRAHLDKVLEREIDRSQRTRQLISLILFDVDHFKHVNDSYGHPAGDRVLRELAAVASAAVRSTDIVFRWGGEEFAVLTIACGYRGAGKTAEGLRTEIARHSFSAAGSLTISAGVAELNGRESADEWFGRADAMLYAAKQDGRNAVRIDARGNSDLWTAEHGLSALHLVWEEAYCSGEPTLDLEHRELFDLANALIDAFLADGDDPAAITPPCDKLIAHIAAHFADEEAILEQHAYAKLEIHRRAHVKLLARAAALRTKVLAGHARLGSIVEFLAGDVVARHLFKMDREFFPLFARRDSRAAR